MNIGGELIQISLGPGSNAITSHLCNLQGLACTTSPHSDAATAAEHSSTNDPLCDPYITHAVQGETYVPRVLFVDGKNCFDSWSSSSRSGESSVNSGVGVGVGKATTAGGNLRTAGDCHDTAASAALGPGLTWRGKVQVYHRQDASQAQSSMSSQDKVATAPSSYNSNDQDQDHDPLIMGTGYNDKQYSDYYRYYSDQLNSNLSPGQRHAFDNFQQTASVLSPSSSANGNRMSRYHSGHYKGISSQFVRNREHGNDDNDRVMKWDMQEEEEDDEWQDTEYAQRKLEEKNRRQEQYNQSLHCDLTNYWNVFLGVGDQAEFDTRERHYQNDTAAAENASMSHAQDHPNGNDDGIREQGNQHPQDHPVRGGTSSDIARHNALSALNWMHYFMPPHPWNDMYSAPLPFHRCSFVKTRKDDISSVQNKHHHQQHQQQQKDQSMLYSYQAGMNPIASSSQSFCSMTEMSMGITREWRENVLSDKLRKWMEDCDCVKGFQILLDGDQAMFGGLAASVLEELSDECKSATKFSVVVHGGDDFLDGGMGMDKGMNMGGDAASELPYWRSENKAVRAFRNDLSQGLLLHGVTSNSDLVLPLSLTRCWQSLDKKDMLRSNLFEASAAAAMILETATLPFRFARGTPKTRSKIGIASGYFHGSSSLEDNDVFPTVDKLTFHEYISSLKPSSHRHVMTEMSCLAHPISPSQLHQSLLQGTSIERRQLEQERNSHRNTYYKRSRGRDIDPGIWMEDCGPNGGILTSLSPINGEFSTRSLHRHFALASSFRALPSTVGDIVSTYTTSLMEGGIIRHRPLSSIASVAGQSFGALTDPSTSCSAGSYWSTIFGSQETRTFQPLSVIGNTTRIYGHLSGTGNAFKTALSQKYKGYLRRDSMAGLVPELEDCEEAKESCFSLRDLYEPPMLGHELDEEGAYYEDNYD